MGSATKSAGKKSSRYECSWNGNSILWVWKCSHQGKAAESFSHFLSWWEKMVNQLWQKCLEIRQDCHIFHSFHGFFHRSRSNEWQELVVHAKCGIWIVGMRSEVTADRTQTMRYAMFTWMWICVGEVFTHLIGFCDQYELFLCLGIVRIFIRVIFQAQSTVLLMNVWLIRWG